MEQPPIQWTREKPRFDLEDLSVAVGDRIRERQRLETANERRFREATEEANSAWAVGADHREQVRLAAIEEHRDQLAIKIMNRREQDTIKAAERKEREDKERVKLAARAAIQARRANTSLASIDKRKEIGDEILKLYADSPSLEAMLASSPHGRDQTLKALEEVVTQNFQFQAAQSSRHRFVQHWHYHMGLIEKLEATREQFMNDPESRQYMAGVSCLRAQADIYDRAWKNGVAMGVIKVAAPEKERTRDKKLLLKALREEQVLLASIIAEAEVEHDAEIKVERTIEKVTLRVGRGAEPQLGQGAIALGKLIEGATVVEEDPLMSSETADELSIALEEEL